MTSEPPSMSEAPEFVHNSDEPSFLDQPPPGLEEQNGTFWGQMLDWEHRTSAVSSGDGQEHSVSVDEQRLPGLLQAFREMRAAQHEAMTPPMWHRPYQNKPFTLFELILDTDELSSELRSEEKELTECLSEPSNLVRLAELISRPGERVEGEEVNHIRLVKLPLVAQDIVCAGTPRIGRLLLQDRVASVTLLSLLDVPPPLDERVAARFANVLAMLMLKCADHLLYSLHFIGERAREFPLDMATEPVFATSLKPAEDPLAYKILRHMGSDAIAECVKCLLTQPAAPVQTFLPSAPTFMLNLVEQIGQHQPWDQSPLDVVERTETIVSVIYHVIMSGPGIQDFDVLLGSLLSTTAFEYLLRGIGCGCADIARASSDLLSLILTKCEEHLSMAEYDAMNSSNSATGSPSPPRSTPLVKPNIPLPPPSPPMIPAGETAPLSVIDTGPVDPVTSGWDSPPASPTGPRSPQWVGDAGSNEAFRIGSNSWQDESNNAGWLENISGGTGGQLSPQQHSSPEDDDPPETAYHNETGEAFRLTDKTLLAMREFTHLVTSGQLQELLCSYIIPQVRAIRQYRKSRRGRNSSPASDTRADDTEVMASSSQSPKNGDSSPLGSDTPRRIFTDTVSQVDFVPAKSMDTTTSATWERMAEEVWGPAPPASSPPPEPLPESTSGSTVPSANEALSPEKSLAASNDEAVGIKLERVDLPQGNKPRVGGLCLSFVTLIHSILQLDTLRTREVASRLVPALVELFFAYKWNTLLHNSVKQILVFIIDVISPNSKEILKRLVNDSRLLPQIVKLCKRSKKLRQERDDEVRRQKRLRHKVGYMPQVIQIAEALIARSKMDQWLLETLTATAGWNRTVVAEVEYTMSITSEPLGSPVPQLHDLFSRIPNTDMMSSQQTGCIGYAAGSSLDDTSQPSSSSDSDAAAPSTPSFGTENDLLRPPTSGSGEQILSGDGDSQFD